MPKQNFDHLVNYATSQGYLQLSQDGGLTLDKSKDDKVGKYLNNHLNISPDGHVQENGLQGPWNNPANEAFRQMEQRARQARLAAAKQAMERGWHNMGGPGAPVGLPLSNKIVIKEKGYFGQGGYSAQFRGGTLDLPPDGMKVESTSHREVNIDLVGIECQIRQEKTDEIYGVISVLGPSNSIIVSHRFPDNGTMDMGPDGMRLSNLNVSLVREGVLQNYYIWASLVENDSGDVDVVARDIADKFASTAGQALGALTGAPAEAVSDSESFKENIATGLAWVFGNILGMGDDAYNAESFSLFWGDLASGSPTLQSPVRRDDDPRSIDQWTHKLTLSGTDDGGDRGQYALYFKVWMEDVTRTIEKSTR
ncbi:MAG: hypothetical protein WAM60_25530 [Candidatus Promineifilaceae bacterium]